jgi:hypothetical protein
MDKLAFDKINFFCSEMVSPSSSSDEEDYELHPSQEEDWEDWMDDGTMDQGKCLYCDLILDHPTIIFDHLVSDHHIHLLEIRKELSKSGETTHGPRIG